MQIAYKFVDSRQNIKYDYGNKTGRVEYIDPQVRDFSANGVVIDQYTQQSDCFSLAVVVFEMLVGFNPFDGVYPLARDYDQPLKALNRISIIGNHNLKKLDSFKIEHVAWMSEGLQNDFLKIGIICISKVNRPQSPQYRQTRKNRPSVAGGE